MRILKSALCMVQLLLRLNYSLQHLQRQMIGQIGIRARVRAIFIFSSVPAIHFQLSHLSIVWLCHELHRWNASRQTSCVVFGFHHRHSFSCEKRKERSSAAGWRFDSAISRMADPAVRMENACRVVVPVAAVKSSEAASVKLPSLPSPSGRL